MTRPDERPRVVLDTNILVAYALMPGGARRRHEAIRACVETAWEGCALLASDATLAELTTVLLRPDFDSYVPLEARARFLAEVTPRFERVAAGPPPRVCRDPDDDMFLELARAGRAGWLVTVDKKLLAVRAHAGARVVRPERFLEGIGLSSG